MNLNINNYNFLDKYKEAKKENNIFKASYIIHIALNDNTNFYKIKSLMNNDFFLKIYYVLRNNKDCNILNNINSLLKQTYNNYIKENKETIIEIQKEIELNILKQPIMYLWKDLELHNTNLSYDKYLEYYNTNNIDLYNNIQSYINKNILYFDLNLFTLIIIYLSYYVNDLLELNINELINLKELNTITVESSNTEKYKLLLNKILIHNVYDTSENIIKKQEYIFKDFSKPIKLYTFTNKFNTYLYNILREGYYSKNLIEWYFIINNKDLPEDLVSVLFTIIFNIDFSISGILYSIIKDLNLEFTYENVKKYSSTIKSYFLLNDKSINMTKLKAEFNNNINKYNLKILDKFILDNYNLDEIFNFNSFNELSYLSPFNDNKYFINEYIKKKRIIYDNDLLELSKIYNSLQLIKSNNEIIILKNTNYLNKLKLKKEDLEFFDKDIIYYYLKELRLNYCIVNNNENNIYNLDNF